MDNLQWTVGYRAKQEEKKLSKILWCEKQCHGHKQSIHWYGCILETQPNWDNTILFQWSYRKKKLRHNKPEKETNNCLERQISINTEHICNSLGQCTVTTQIDMNHKIELQTLEVQPDKEIDSLKSFDSFLRFSLRISKNASFQLHALPGRIHHHCTL